VDFLEFSRIPRLQGGARDRSEALHGCYESITVPVKEEMDLITI
jgi:hypothetical protein